VAVLLPKHGIEVVGDFEFRAPIERYGALVFGSDSEGESTEAFGTEAERGLFDQQVCEAAAAHFRRDAELCDVSDIFADAGAENKADEFPGGTAHENTGGRGVEVSATGEADDIVKEAQRAGSGAVLIVDVTVEVSAICRCDEMGGGVEIVFAPGAKLKIGVDGGCSRRDIREQIAAHEETPVNGKPGGNEDVRQLAVRIKKQLRFDAFDAG